MAAWRGVRRTRTGVLCQKVSGGVAVRLNQSSWLLGAVVICVVAWHLRAAPWTPLRVTGAVVCCVGFALVSAARYQLGRSFSLQARATRLVTGGLYARLRNPIYVFAELFLAGLAMFMLSWWPVVLLVAAIPLQWVRARREAAVLEAAFGEEYVAYRRRTWF